MKKESVKVTINLSVDLLKRIEDYADSLNINRSSAMSVLMSLSLEHAEVMNGLNNSSFGLSDLAR